MNSKAPFLKTLGLQMRAVRVLVLQVRNVSIGALLFWTTSCADFERGPPPVDAGTSVADAAIDQDANTAGVSFVTEVHPIILENCQRCHQMSGEASRTALLLTGDLTADHAVLLDFVDLAAPASSRLLLKASGQGHSTVLNTSTEEFQKILAWIQDGAGTL